MSNGEEEERFFDHYARPDPPPDPVDGEPRLRGDLLIQQLVRASVPAGIREGTWLFFAVGRLVLWELPKTIIEIVILEPLQRRRWRRGKP